MKEVQKLRELLAEYETLYTRMEEIEATFEKIGVILAGGRIRRKPTKKKRKKKKATGNERRPLTEAKVRSIRKLLKDSDLTIKAIGQKYGVSTSMISAISSGRAWAKVK